MAKRKALQPKSFEIYSEQDIEVRAYIDYLLKILNLNFMNVFENKNQVRELVAVRQIITAITFLKYESIYQITLFNKCKLGDLIGKDHATVIYCLSKYNDVINGANLFEQKIVLEQLTPYKDDYFKDANRTIDYEGFRIIKNIEGLVKILNMENVKLPFRGERIDEAKAYIDGLVYSKNKMQSQL
jgi:hypothetical protein